MQNDKIIPTILMGAVLHCVIEAFASVAGLALTVLTNPVLSWVNDAYSLCCRICTDIPVECCSESHAHVTHVHVMQDSALSS